MTSPKQEQDIPVLSVSQLTNAIKLSLESTFAQIQLEGEVSNRKLQASGHFYFSLKDDKAQIAAVMFKGSASKVVKLPKDGDKVIVRGEINVYPPSGKYQIIVRDIRPVGEGELLLRLEELKKKLHQKGWFRAEHKKSLPKFPKRIGVVTSPTGAAIQDMLNILKRRAQGFHLILNPVRVQGSEASAEIAQAIKQFNDYNLVDVIIVGRGGGSIEDLWAFNEEIVAEAIFNSRIPVIGAVGHETDHCIAEYVADVRAPTPSAAAEIVTAELSQHMKYLDGVNRQLQQTVQHLVTKDRHRLEGIMRQPVFATPYALLGTWIQRLDDLRHGIDQNMLHLIAQKKLLLEERRKHANSLKPTSQILHFHQQLSYFQKSLGNSMSRLVGLRKERLENLAVALHTINPKNLLTKGYSILFAEKDRSIVTSVHDLKSGQDIRALLPDGEVVSTVKDIIPHE